jgi:CheY-like chemotaxis protein
MSNATDGPPLAGRRVLVVEDEYLIADDLAELLRRAGAELIGPAASLPKAVRLLEHGEKPDAAVLDINLRGIDVFPLVDQLAQRDVPMLFLTGYGAHNIPPRFSHIRRCEKPMEVSTVVSALGDLLNAEPAAA